MEYLADKAQLEQTARARGHQLTLWRKQNGGYVSECIHCGRLIMITTSGGHAGSLGDSCQGRLSLQ